VPAAVVCDRGAFEVEIIGERRRALIALQPLYDPRGERMRLS
jgi:dimethylglycine dehydrogenase